MASAEPEAAAVAPVAEAPRAKLVDGWLADMAELRDLDPDCASEEEMGKVAQLRAAVLKAQGLEGPPEGVWQAHFYLRATVLRFLRGRNGNVEPATEMMVNAMKWFEEVKYWNDWVRKYEDQDPPEQTALLRRYCPEGPFGVDKRGAPVLYFRTGLKDTAGMIRETSWEVVLRHHVHCLERDRNLHLHACIKAGKSLMGGTAVLDHAGTTWARSKASVGFLLWFTKEVLSDRFPESVQCVYCVNVPWFFKMGWTLMQPVLPEATKAKMRFYRGDFLQPLQERIDIDQIPAFLGGKSPEPWPYGEGGDVPNSKGEDAGGEDAPTSLEVARAEAVAAEVPAGKTLIWEWCVKELDIDCTVSADGKELVSKRRVTAEDSWQSGKFTAGADAAASVTLAFDNSYSWMRKKRVLYKTFVVETATESPLD